MFIMSAAQLQQNAVFSLDVTKYFSVFIGVYH